MAKQKSPVVKLKGSIDDLSFYRTQDGFLAREKRGIDPERLKSDPAFKNTRSSMAEFSSGGQSAKLFRSAWINEMAIASDNRVTSRSVKAMMNVLKSDTVNRFGTRIVAAGNLTLLEGFEFNVAAPLLTCLKAEIAVAFNRATGEGTVTIPALVPEVSIAVPEMATHYRLFATAAVIDFAAGSIITDRVTTAALPWNEDEAPAVTLQPALPANSTAAVFIVLGIEYVAIINGFTETISKNANACKLITVEPAPAEEI